MVLNVRPELLSHSPRRVTRVSSWFWGNDHNRRVTGLLRREATLLTKTVKRANQFSPTSPPLCISISSGLVVRPTGRPVQIGHLLAGLGGRKVASNVLEGIQHWRGRVRHLYQEVSKKNPKFMDDFHMCFKKSSKIRFLYDLPRAREPPKSLLRDRDSQ